MGNKWNDDNNRSHKIGYLNVNYKNDFLSINADIDFDALADRIDNNKRSKYERIENDSNYKQIEE